MKTEKDIRKNIFGVKFARFMVRFWMVVATIAKKVRIHARIKTEAYLEFADVYCDHVDRSFDDVDDMIPAR